MNMAFTFGERIRVSIFGQSHSEAMGVVLDGYPAGVRLDMEKLRAFMRRRAPGGSPLSTARREEDAVHFLSGVVDGVTCGAPICAVIENTDARSQDYEALRHLPRPSHADLAAWQKCGEARDIRGGGEYSGRLTAPLCVAGCLCLQLLEQRGIVVGAHIAAVGTVCDAPFPLLPDAAALRAPGEKDFPVVSDAAGARMREEILQAKRDGDSIGGSIECAVTGVPAGTGGAMFGGLEGRLSAALFGIPAVKGVEFGSGFAGCALRGSEYNDAIIPAENGVRTRTNHCGGILGGISDGSDIIFRAAVKPTPSISMEQDTVNKSGENIRVRIKGRHDPIIVPRAVVVVEAMAALTTADLLLLSMTSRLDRIQGFFGVHNAEHL